MIEELKNIPAREWIHVLESDGFQLRKGKGSHHIYQHPDKRRVLIVYHSLHDTFGPKTLKSLLQDSGWTRDDLKRFELIK